MSSQVHFPINTGYSGCPFCCIHSKYNFFFSNSPEDPSPFWYSLHPPVISVPSKPFLTHYVGGLDPSLLILYSRSHDPGLNSFPLSTPKLKIRSVAYGKINTVKE